MKKQSSQRKLAVLDPNVAIGVRKPSKKQVAHGQENSLRKRKTQEDDNESVGGKKLFLEFLPESQKFEVTSHFLDDQWTLTPDYMQEIFNVELELEKKYKVSPQFCSNPLFPVTPNHREIVAEWLLDLQVFLKVGNEVLNLAVNIMDLVLDCRKVEENEMQTLASAAMWLAYKFYNGGIKAKAIVKFSKNISQESLKHYEKTIFRVIGFDVLFTNPYNILHWYLYQVFGKEIPRIEYHACNYLLDIMLLNIDFVRDPMSLRAEVAVQLVLHLFQEKENTILTNSPRSRIMRTKLCAILRMVRDNTSYRKVSSLFKKYSSVQYSQVSLHPCLDPDSIKI